MERTINLPKWDYMCQGNTYSGSIGDFRYKFFVSSNDEIEKVFVASTYKNNCFEVEDAAGRTTKKEFEYSAKGIDAAERWINGQLLGD